MTGLDLGIGPPTAAPPPPPGAEPDPSVLGPAPTSAIDDVDVPLVDEAMVRALLVSGGMGANAVFADDDVPKQWVFDEIELQLLVPALTRIVNKRPALRRAVAHGDLIAVLTGAGRYGSRNVMAGRAARAARGEDDDGDGDGEAGPAAGGARAADARGGAVAAWYGGADGGHGVGGAEPAAGPEAR